MKQDMKISQIKEQEKRLSDRRQEFIVQLSGGELNLNPASALAFQENGGTKGIR